MKKKFLFLMLITIFMLVLTACGGSLETTVNLNTDLSGTRTMKYVITKSDFAEYVSGDITAVDATMYIKEFSVEAELEKACCLSSN